MSVHKKRQADVGGLANAPDNPSGREEAHSEIASDQGKSTLPELPSRWFWAACAAAQLRILATDPSPSAQGMAMCRYCICLALINGPNVGRWTGYAAGVLKGHATIPKCAHRWRIGYIQGVVDFAEWWIPIVMTALAATERDATEIPEVDAT